MKKQYFSVVINNTIYGREYEIKKYNLLDDPYFMGSFEKCERYIKSIINQKLNQ